MGKERYSDSSELSAFGFLLSSLGGSKNGNGDTGNVFPRSDAEDMSKGARFVPGEVTLARRAGKKINFVTECGPNCWYWEMPDGSRIYHYDPMTYRLIGISNGRKATEREYGGIQFKGGVGPCPRCGNVNTDGGTIKP
jgi:hypothetical protein